MNNPYEAETDLKNPYSNEVPNGSVYATLEGEVRYPFVDIRKYSTEPDKRLSKEAKSNPTFVLREGGEFIVQWKEKRGDFEYAIGANFTYFDSFWMNNPTTYS